MKLKVLDVVRPKSLVIAAAAVNTALEMGLEKDVVITSGNNGVHMTNSKHYLGDALDLRSHHLTASERSQFMALLRVRLGVDYEVILEDVGGPNEHLHVERDVKVKQS